MVNCTVVSLDQVPSRMVDLNLIDSFAVQECLGCLQTPVALNVTRIQQAQDKNQVTRYRLLCSKFTHLFIYFDMVTDLKFMFVNPVCCCNANVVLMWKRIETLGVRGDMQTQLRKSPAEIQTGNHAVWWPHLSATTEQEILSCRSYSDYFQKC